MTTMYKGKAPNGDSRIVTVKYLYDFDEWKCLVTDNGIRQPNVDYYTNDEEDAHETAKHMCGLIGDRIRD